MNVQQMTDLEQQRASHADFSQRKRLHKARKIATLLAPYKTLRGANLLDVGTGSGYIASALAEVVGSDGSVTSIDCVDERQIRVGYRFIQVADCQIPCDDNSFDVAVSNHVIEHTGADADQRTHLRELHRVLRPDGVLYFAAPSRWAPIEPHFRLPLLSWFPAAWRSTYVRATGRGTHYDCFPRSSRTYRQLLAENQFAPTNVSAEAISALAAIESDTPAGQLAGWLPARWLGLLPCLPTAVFVARPVGKQLPWDGREPVGAESSGAPVADASFTAESPPVSVS